MAEVAARDVVDVLIPLGAGSVPVEHREALWRALADHVPWLADEPGLGVHPLRGAVSGASVLLPRRARLVIRLRRERAGALDSLGGLALRIGEASLVLGVPSVRELEPYPTLGSALVLTDSADDLAHHGTVAALLEAARLPVRFICGALRRHRLGGAERSGSSVVVHDVREPDAIRLLVEGLGEARNLGCGIFVPARRITGIE